MHEVVEKYSFFHADTPVQTDQSLLMKHLQRPTGPVDVVLDTDTYNEIDDQYALAYLVLNPEKLHLKAIFAAPFANAKADTAAEGMEKSYREIENILTLMDRRDLLDIACRGSTAYLPDEKTPVDSPAARRLVELARSHSPEDPLYVIAIAAITNVASALLLDPSIRDNIVVVWLGGHALHYHDNHEFNLMQDVAGARVLFGCGCAVVLLPGMGVVSAFATTESELRENIKGKNKLCDYLYSYTTSECKADSKVPCWSKPIWDVTAVGWLLGEYTLDEYITSPIPEYDHRWGSDPRRHTVRYVYHIKRDLLFNDLFEKLRSF